MQIGAGFLAGGLARRMGGGDKAELQIAGRTILQWQLEATAHIPVRILNANGETGRFNKYGLPIVTDIVEGHLGPLAGIHAMLHHVEVTHKDITHLLSLATDAPFIPKTLDLDLSRALRKGDAEIAIAHSAGRHHPVFTLWPVSLRVALEEALRDRGVRKIDDFTEGYETEFVPFEGTPDPFMNINRPEDLQRAQIIANGL